MIFMVADTNRCCIGREHHRIAKSLNLWDSLPETNLLDIRRRPVFGARSPHHISGEELPNSHPITPGTAWAIGQTMPSRIRCWARMPSSDIQSRTVNSNNDICVRFCPILCLSPSSTPQPDVRIVNGYVTVVPPLTGQEQHRRAELSPAAQNPGTTAPYTHQSHRSSAPAGVDCSSLVVLPSLLAWLLSHMLFTS